MILFEKTITDNIFSSIDYLYRVDEVSSKQSNIFINAGFYFGLQNIKVTYKNNNIRSDTTTVAFKRDSLYRFTPPAKDYKVNQFNYNISFGLTHILSTEKINVKSQLSVGLNVFNYPYSASIFNSVDSSYRSISYFKLQKNFFAQLRIEATVLNPGISIGFETFIRGGQIPLFNLNLTKVVDIEKIGALFGKIPSSTD